MWCAQLDERYATMAGSPRQGLPERFEFAFYRWIWNYTRDSQPRLDAAQQQHRQLRVIELRTRRSTDGFHETI